MALLMCVLWAACAGPLWGLVHRLPQFRDAAEPQVARDTFRPSPRAGPLPPRLATLLIPPAVPQQPWTPHPHPRGPVDVWCGRRQVSIRVDRKQLRHWRDPNRFRLSSCGVSGVSSRYLYFHRGLAECGGSVQVVGGQLVYTYVLTFTGPSYGFVFRAPPLNMALSCHYNRFHYSYRVGFQPHAPAVSFLKSIHSQSSFSLSVCNSQWEVVSPEHSFLLGESVHFMAQTGPLRAGERLYVDSCSVTSSGEPHSSQRVDIISNFGCMVDSERVDSSSQFVWRGSSDLRFIVDTFLFRTEGQMLFLHCTMSIGLQPSPSSKSCTYNTAVRRWMELEASPSVCSCCSSVCGEPRGADSTMVSSAAWFLAAPQDELHQEIGSIKRGPGLNDELHQEIGSIKRGPGLNDELHQETVSLKTGPGLKEDLDHQEIRAIKRGSDLKEELHQETVSLKRGPDLVEDLHQGDDVSLTRGDSFLKNELHEDSGFENHVTVEFSEAQLQLSMNQSSAQNHTGTTAVAPDVSTAAGLSS